MRSEAEARVACAGGCDILDVKEPSRGSLGMAPVDVLSQISARLTSTPQAPPLSMALGELAEWPDDRPLPALPPGIAFLKVGVAGLTRDEVADRLARLQERFVQRQSFPPRTGRDEAPPVDSGDLRRLPGGPEPLPGRSLGHRPHAGLCGGAD